MIDSLSSLVVKSDKTTPYVLEDIGLTPYIIEVDFQLGSKVKIGELGRNGTLTMTLNNETGIFDIYRADNIFADVLLTNRLFILEDANGDRLWSGYIENVEIDIASNSRTVEVNAKQSLEIIRERGLSNPLYLGQSPLSISKSLVTDNQMFTSALEGAFVLGASKLDEDRLTVDAETYLDSFLSDTVNVTYASRSWGENSKLSESLEELLDLRTGYGFIDESGRLKLYEFYSYKIASLTSSINLEERTGNDIAVTSLKLKTRENIVNSFKMDYYGLTDTTDLVQEVTIGDLSSTDGEQIRTVKVASKTNEEKLYIIDVITLSASSGLVSLSLISNTVDSVTFSYSTEEFLVEDVVVTLTLDVLAEEEPEVLTVENSNAIALYRKVYQEQFTNNLVTTEVEAQEYLGLRSVYTSRSPATLEEIDASNLLLGLGEVYGFSSPSYEVGGNYMIVGARHRISRERQLTSTYYVFGGNQAPIFTLNSSTLDSGDIIL